MNLNIQEWRLFKVGEVLGRNKIPSISKELRKFKNGNGNVIGNSQLNNGIIYNLEINDSKYIHSENSLSYGAKGGKFFYQKNKWASTDHVHMFVSNKLNENNQLFICTIMNKLISIKGGWCSSLESNIIDEYIKLPIDKDGAPDWKYMEDYIKQLTERVLNLFSLALN